MLTFPCNQLPFSCSSKISRLKISLRRLKKNRCAMCFSFSSLNYRWCSLSKEKLLQRAIQGVFTQASSILQNCLGFCETLPVHLTVEILKLRKFLSYIFLAPHCPVHQSGHHGCNLQSDVKSFTKYWASFSNLTQSLCFLQLLIS